MFDRKVASLQNFSCTTCVFTVQFCSGLNPETAQTTQRVRPFCFPVMNANQTHPKIPPAPTCFRNEAVRQNPVAPEHSRFSLVCVGHTRAKHGSVLPEDMTQFVGIVWCMDGEIERRFDGHRARLRPGWASIVLPGTLMHYTVISKTAELRFFAVDGLDAEKRVFESGLWEGEFPSGPPPEGWLEILYERLIKAEWNGDDVASSAAYDLLVRLGENVRRMTSDKLVYEARRIIHGQWQDDKLNVAKILKHLKVDRSTLSRRFLRATGRSALDYLLDLRIHKAQRLLINTAKPIAEVGASVGLSNPVYFSRLFTQRVGLSPRAFRLNPLGEDPQD